MNRYRKLAAIMFTDIVGYTALMGDDEQTAFELLHKNRHLQKNFITEFNGTWIKEMGDGVLASFQTVTDAIYCAISMQQESCKIEGLKLRIGIHLGEVVFEENDVFGDGVNIASRLQANAPISGIWISEPVFKTLINKKEIHTRFVREELLKNVKEPVKIYEVDTTIQIKHRKAGVTSFPKKNHVPSKSIAVLPFANMSNDPEQEYFSDGMAEEIINSLAHLKDLKVAGRLSSRQFKGTNTDLQEVGAKLGVATVMEGSVRKQGNRLRITAQLINVADGFHLWSEQYDRKVDDVFAIQEEIALALTEKLKITLLDHDRIKIAQTCTQNTEAYDLYLRGLFYLGRRGASILKAITAFEKAKLIDSNFALAYVGLADANLLMASYGLAPSKLMMEKAKEAADKAIEIDPLLSQPYCSLGFYYTCYEWNWTAAKTNFLKSLELDPNYPEAHYRYGWNYLTWVEGNLTEAIRQGEIAIKLEPLSSPCFGVYSLILHTAGKYEEALAAARAGLELDAYSFLCLLNEGDSNRALGRIEEAIQSYEKALTISNRHPFAINGMIWAFCILKDFTKAQTFMEELKERAKKEYIPSTFTALSAAHLGNLDDSFYFLDKAFDDREPILLTLKNENWVPSILKKEKRFQELMAKIGFPL